VVKTQTGERGQLANVSPVLLIFNFRSVISALVFV
jgi:flavin reductase (DIM6/NTAB) family NADH-FMN oxidoreductase RutF